MAVNFEILLASSLIRLKEAQAVADSLRPASEVHRLAMRAVFVLEDCYEALRRIRDQAAESVQAK